VDAWLYVDNEPLSAYEMPVSVPVLKQGNHEIKVRGGVIVNGISATRVYYPFFTFHVETVDLKPGEVIQVNPVVQYFSGTVFSLNENFDGAGISLVSTPQSDTVLQRIPGFENLSASVYLDAQHSIFECASDDTLHLPDDGNPVYMELNYKCNTEFSVGVFSITSFAVERLPVLTLRAAGEWKKVYINLSDATAAASGALGFKPYIHCDRDNSVGDTQLFFDNVKVVHF
jgi:hypothetical protein